MRVTINWLKEFVSFSWTPEQLAQQLTDAGIEVASITPNPFDPTDFVLELEITANRPDLLSVIGVAREIGALIGIPLRLPEISITESNQLATQLAKVTILAPELCPRYSARVITGIKVGPSPDWMAHRLEAVGIRAINNVVDITNYVLMEYGHPMHAFDLRYLEGPEIIVRNPKPDETMRTLDEQERKVAPDMLVIADAKKPVALAGIMGGANSQVFSSTKDILLESAYFNPVSIRKTSSALGLKTEASYRFERGADPEGTIPSVNRGIQLIQQLAGGTVARGIIDAYPKPIPSPTVTMRVSRTNHVLGTKLNKEKIQDIMTRLQLLNSSSDTDKIEVTIPSFRRDIYREIDLIEEIARIYGYNQIPTTSPTIRITPYRDEEHRFDERQIRERMTACGFQEAINHALVDPVEWQKLAFESDTAIPLKNPLSVEQSQVRNSLLPSLIWNVGYNLKQGAAQVALFELNYAMTKDVTSPTKAKQASQLAAILYRKPAGQTWDEEVTFADYYFLKGVLGSVLEMLHVDPAKIEYIAIQRPYLHLKRAAGILVEGKQLGLIGQLANPIAEELDIKKETYLFELDLDAVYALPKIMVQYQALPKYPAIVRDISMLVPQSVNSAEVVAVIQSIAQEKVYPASTVAGAYGVAAVNLFDLYSGDKIPAGYRSLSYRVTYRAEDRTLSDEEVNLIHQQVLNLLTEKLQIKIR